VHLLGGLLTKVVGDAELACRILLVALAVSWVASARFLFRAFGADPRLSVMSALLFWNRALVVGFIPYIASLALLFVALALFIRVSESPERPTHRRLAVLAIVAIVIFYVHASAFTLLAATACAVALVNSWSRYCGEPHVARRVVLTFAILARVACGSFQRAASSRSGSCAGDSECMALRATMARTLER
jgi:hypothetical protein